MPAVQVWCVCEPEEQKSASRPRPCGILPRDSVTVTMGSCAELAPAQRPADIPSVGNWSRSLRGFPVACRQSFLRLRSWRGLESLRWRRVSRKFAPDHVSAEFSVEQGNQEDRNQRDHKLSAIAASLGRGLRRFPDGAASSAFGSLLRVNLRLMLDLGTE